jgi:hypothetical protein
MRGRKEISPEVLQQTIDDGVNRSGVIRNNPNDPKKQEAFRRTIGTVIRHFLKVEDGTPLTTDLPALRTVRTNSIGQAIEDRFGSRTNPFGDYLPEELGPPNAVSKSVNHAFKTIVSALAEGTSVEEYLKGKKRQRKNSLGSGEYGEQRATDESAPPETRDRFSRRLR